MSSYNLRETEALRRAWTKDKLSVNECAVKFNRTPKSIIAKLSKEGLYEAKGYVTKQGKRPETKLSKVRRLEQATGENFAGLEEVNKQTLERLFNYLMTLEDNYEKALITIKALKQQQMYHDSGSKSGVGLGEGFLTASDLEYL